MVWNNRRVAHVGDTLPQGSPPGCQLEKLQAQPYVHQQDITLGHTLTSTVKHSVFHRRQPEAIHIELFTPPLIRP